MTALFISMVMAFGAINIHVKGDCHRGGWCHATGLALMEFNADPYQSVNCKGWPPYFQPVICSPVQGVTKQYIVQAQYGEARR